MDAFLCYLQKLVKKVSSVRFRALPVRLGVGRHSRSQFRCLGGEQVEGDGIAMARLIEFYVPNGFRPRQRQAPEQCSGIVIEFRGREAKQSDLRLKGRSESHLKACSVAFDVQKR